ncbi:MAG: hypothetical protein BroJett030_12830 [Alphaproteobacteria bacterium]|nr:MAG: hypothetical protein BroJett030_12830 [Alphaproteobacteria bacterium]
MRPHLSIVAPGRVRLLAATLLLALSLAVQPRLGHAASDAELINGFNLTVFGAEYAPFGYQSDYIRKFEGTARFYIHNLSQRNRVAEVSTFILSLNRLIHGLRTQVVTSPGQANFHVYIVDRVDYAPTVREKVYGHSTANTPGRCLVRSIFSRNGIKRSDAVIVSDEGEALFNRCKIEEILQGLGPLNEHPSLRESMFNDFTRHTSFTRFDRIILNMLYDPRIKNGASKQSVQSLLPAVLRTAKARVR